LVTLKVPVSDAEQAIAAYEPEMFELLLLIVPLRFLEHPVETLGVSVAAREAPLLLTVPLIEPELVPAGN
jgi:hypothetical protein